jgi:hypothetical protein
MKAITTALALAGLALSITPAINAGEQKPVQTPVSASQNAKPNPKILKSVTVEASFAQWPDENHYKSWQVRIIRPSDYAAGKSFAEKKESFPVSPDGSFKAVIHNVEKGDGYYLESPAGSQRFAIYSDKVVVDVISPDAAG